MCVRDLHNARSSWESSGKIISKVEHLWSAIDHSMGQVTRKAKQRINGRRWQSVQTRSRSWTPCRSSWLFWIGYFGWAIICCRICHSNPCTTDGNPLSVSGSAATRFYKCQVAELQQGLICNLIKFDIHFNFIDRWLNIFFHEKLRVTKFNLESFIPVMTLQPMTGVPIFVGTDPHSRHRVASCQHHLSTRSRSINSN